jgi:hypothetical protein
LTRSCYLLASTCNSRLGIDEDEVKQARLFDRDGDGFGEGVAQEGRFCGGSDTDLISAPEGELFAKSETHAGPNPLGGEVAEHLRIFVGDAGDLCGLAGAKLREGLWFLARQRTVHGGDRVAMRIELGVAELGGDALFEALRDEMFEAFGLLMHLVPGIVEDLMEESFDEAMVANDLESSLLSGFGERYAVVLLVDDKWRLLRGELLQHVGDGGCGDGQVDGDFGAGDLAFRSAAELKDGLEVVIDGFTAD